MPVELYSVGIDLISFPNVPAPLNIQNIYQRLNLQANQSVESQNPTYRLQLSDKGCALPLSNDVNYKNCSAVCSNPKLLFGISERFDPLISHNLLNCLTYALASDLLSRQLLNSEAQIALVHFGINNDTDTRKKVADTLTGCLGVYCSNETGCGNLYQTINWYSRPTLIPDYQHVCNNAPTQLNGDLGGIGIIIAFALESLIVLLIWLTLRASRILLFHNLISSGKKSQQRPNYPLKGRVAALITFLTDFQKAQCTFWLAMGISMLLTTYGSPELLSLRTLGALVNNVAWLKTFSPGGVVLMTFTTHLLLSSGNRSWYIFCLSAISSIILTAAYVSFDYLSPADIVPETHGDWKYACGPASPATFCTGSGIESTVDFSDPRLSKGLVTNDLPRPDFTAFFSPLIALCFAWFRLLLDCVEHLLWPTMPIPKWLRRRLPALSTSELLHTLNNGMVPRAVFIVIHAVFDFFHAFTIILFIAVVIVPAGTSTSVTTSRDWGFGQVVAVLVWLPVLTDGLYSMIRGFVQASQHRILPPFQVVNMDDNGRLSNRESVEDPLMANLAVSGLHLAKLPQKDNVILLSDESVAVSGRASAITYDDRISWRSLESDGIENHVST